MSLLKRLWYFPVNIFCVLASWFSREGFLSNNTAFEFCLYIATICMTIVSTIIGSWLVFVLYIAVLFIIVKMRHSKYKPSVVVGCLEGYANTWGWTLLVNIIVSLFTFPGVFSGDYYFFTLVIFGTGLFFLGIGSVLGVFAVVDDNDTFRGPLAKV